jgi:hypothetical protein
VNIDDLRPRMRRTIVLIEALEIFADHNVGVGSRPVLRDNRGYFLFSRQRETHRRRR